MKAMQTIAKGRVMARARAALEVILSWVGSRAGKLLQLEMQLLESGPSDWWRTEFFVVSWMLNVLCYGYSATISLGQDALYRDIQTALNQGLQLTWFFKHPSRKPRFASRMATWARIMRMVIPLFVGLLLNTSCSPNTDEFERESKRGLHSSNGTTKRNTHLCRFWDDWLWYFNPPLGLFSASRASKVNCL